MYEHRNQPLLSRAEFRKRIGRYGLVALGIVVFGLGFGVLGYHFIGQLGWIDSLLNASMILGGMGPVDTLGNNAAKISLRFMLCFQVWRLSVSCRSCLPLCASHAASFSRGNAWMMQTMKLFARKL